MNKSGRITCRKCGKRYGSHGEYLADNCEDEMCAAYRTTEKKARAAALLNRVVDESLATHDRDGIVAPAFKETVFETVSELRHAKQPRGPSYYRDIPPAIVTHCI